MGNTKLTDYQKIILVLFALVFVCQFFLPFFELRGESVTAFQAYLHYGDVHWGSNYFIVIMLLTALSFFIFLVGLKKKYSKHQHFAYWLCFIIVPAEFFFAIQLGDHLKAIDSTYRDLAPNLVVTFFSLAFIALLGLIEYMKRQQPSKKEWYDYDISMIVVVSVVLPLSTFIGAKLGIGAVFGGAIGGVIAWMVLKIKKK